MKKENPHIQVTLHTTMEEENNNSEQEHPRQHEILLNPEEDNNLFLFLKAISTQSFDHKPTVKQTTVRGRRG